MWRAVINSKSVIKQSSVNHVLRNISNRYIEVNNEVKQALIQNKPVVALESTIITHGLPYPQNLQCVREVEAVVREKGATPATIAILGGKVKVGLTDTELEELADSKNALKTIKTSRRDFGYVIGNKLNGGTTVAGTLIVANAVGIRVFATGGLGGVHRMGEKTFDISADLTELGKSPVAVISCGVKSILDIPKTLEYLETQGVLVATFGNDKIFPAFYCRHSNSESPYNVRNAKEAANIIGCHLGLNLKSGLLFAVPIPEEFAMNEEDMNAVIDKAMISAEKRGISGKEITPYLLSQIMDITKGSSLRSNMGLIKNNASVAADIAVELSHLNQNFDANQSYLKSPEVNIDHGNEKLENKQPMVIGGSVLDSCAILKENDVVWDGRIHEANIRLNAGGVGRNMTEAMCKLGAKPKFLSIVGDDSYGDYVKSLLPSSSSENILQLANHSTSQCTIIFDKHGECKMLIGDMNIHQRLTPNVIRDHEDLIRNSPLLILDGNLSISGIEETLKLAEKHQVPVFFEPTDIPVSIKPFLTSYWKSIKYITPNLLELKEIAKSLNISLPSDNLNEIEQAALIAKMVAVYIPHVIVTMGSKGLIIANSRNASDPLFYQNYSTEEGLKVKHYPVIKIDNITNVSGAGDCLASGLIVAMLDGLSEEKCVAVGFAAARAALFSHSPVPNALFNKNDIPWMEKAEHQLL